MLNIIMRFRGSDHSIFNFITATSYYTIATITLRGRGTYEIH